MSEKRTKEDTQKKHFFCMYFNQYLQIPGWVFGIVDTEIKYKYLLT